MLLIKPSLEIFAMSPTSPKIPLDPFLNVLPHLKFFQAQYPDINLNPTFFAINNNSLRSMGRLIIGIPTIKRFEVGWFPSNK
uniref:Uncharacterized protein n=1 Tax=Panagrolaimus superbus TaxID=310955 RepID=A0A914Z556_9BILA